MKLSQSIGHANIVQTQSNQTWLPVHVAGVYERIPVECMAPVECMTSVECMAPVECMTSVECMAQLDSSQGLPTWSFKHTHNFVF